MARAKQTELDLIFDLPVDKNSVSFIDLGQCYSLVNRIFARQGMQYAIAGIQAHGSTATEITISRLPESWPCINAWEKTYHVWRESQAQVLEHSPGIEGRYHDFKVHMDETHHTAGFANNLIPDGFAVTGFGVSFGYDWLASHIQIPNDPAPGTTTEFNLHVLGDSNLVSKGMIAGYAASRGRPQQVDPNVPDAPLENWMQDAFDVGDDLDEIRADLLAENDEPPYVVGVPGDPDTFYPGGGNQGGIVKEAILILRGGLGTQTFTGGFTAPAGLLRMVCASSDETTGGQIRISLMAGGYKGCMARPMQKVN